MVRGAFMKGEALVTKAAAIAQYGVLPGAMIVAIFYSPPDYTREKKPEESSSSSSSSSSS